MTLSVVGDQKVCIIFLVNLHSILCKLFGTPTTAGTLIQLLKIIFIFMLLIIFNPHLLKAQVIQEWVATFQTVTGYNIPNKNAIDKFDNLIAAGNSDSDHDYVTLKYSSFGSKVFDN